MKKLIKLLILVTVFSFGWLNVNAASLSLDGDKTVNSGTSGSVDVVLTTGGDEIVKLEFSIEPNSPMLGIIKSTSQVIAGEPALSKTIFSVADGEIFADGIIASLKITNSSGSLDDSKMNLKISNVKFYYKNNPETAVTGADYAKEITLKATTTTTTTAPLKTNPKLTGLTVSSGKMTPAFNANTTEYKVFNVKDTLKNITITPKCDDCSWVIRCTIGCTNTTNQLKPELEIGKNILTISTTSQDKKSTAEYILTIYRGETTDNSALLSAISVEGFELSEKFDKDVLDYTLSVPNDIKSIKVNATAEDSNAKVEIKGADELIVGENVITITITSAETEDKKIYNITVTRLEEGEEEPTTTAPAKTAEKEKKDKTLLIIIISVICLSIIGLSGYLIFKKKKPKNKKQKPEIITDEGEIEKTVPDMNLSVNENELEEDLNIKDDISKPTVEEALADLMETREIALQDNETI